MNQINEMSMAWVNKNANTCCWIENPSGYQNDYFKYYNSFSYRKADKVARISLIKPEYLEHTNYDGKDNWVLNSKERKELIDFMNKPSKVHKGLTNWQTTLVQYNFDNFYIDPEDTINSTFNIEEYPNAFDIKTPMPNYLEL